jgi:hypothetical protein
VGREKERQKGREGKSEGRQGERKNPEVRRRKKKARRKKERHASAVEEQVKSTFLKRRRGKGLSAGLR